MRSSRALHQRAWRSSGFPRFASPTATIHLGRCSASTSVQNPAEKTPYARGGFREANARSRRRPEIVSGKRCPLFGQFSRTQKVNERSAFFEDYRFFFWNGAFKHLFGGCLGGPGLSNSAFSRG